MGNRYEALDFLAAQELPQLPAVVVVAGEEIFLKRQVLSCIKAGMQDGQAEDDLAWFEVEAAQTTWADIRAELETIPMFGGDRRVVLVRSADALVTQERKTLEGYVAKPIRRASLILETTAWLENTNLHKQLVLSGWCVVCNPLPARSLPAWCQKWAQQSHGAKIDADAAGLLTQLTNADMGRMDQELAKLRLLVDSKRGIQEADVAQFVGGWVLKKVWDMLDEVLAGHPSKALEQLWALLLSGENPVGILAQIGSSLRRLAAASRLVDIAERRGQRLTLREALERTGTKTFFLSKSEAQVRHLGRKRASGIFRALLDTDLALKGGSALEPRLVLERLIVKLATPAAPAVAAARR